jgi:septal ring factor EnvC (AmiA/AmiB activator)
MFSLP